MLRHLGSFNFAHVNVEAVSKVPAGQGIEDYDCYTYAKVILYVLVLQLPDSCSTWVPSIAVLANIWNQSGALTVCILITYSSLCQERKWVSMSVCTQVNQSNVKQKSKYNKRRSSIQLLYCTFFQSKLLIHVASRNQQFKGGLFCLNQLVLFFVLITQKICHTKNNDKSW